MVKYKNTLKKGLLRYVTFKEGDVWYAVCLEFNLVETGTTPQEALLLLLEASAGYLETARKIKARPAVLNQKSDEEYEEMWRKARNGESPKRDEVFSAGTLNIGQLSQSLVLL